MYVVTGATGNTGAVVAHRLLDAGERVRVVVRSAEKAAALASRGAEVVVADLNDRGALAGVLAGSKGVYLVSPPDVATNTFLADKERLAATFAHAVEAASVPHVVLLSSIGAHRASGTGVIRSLYAIETALRNTAAATTFLRAAYFVENWASVLPAARDGILPSFLPADRAIPTIAVRDIGGEGARRLLAGPRGEEIVDLHGPVDASANDVARALTTILGRSVKVAPAPLDGVVPTFTSFGISKDVATLYREMYQGIVDGAVAAEPGVGTTVRGPTTIEQALTDLA